MRLKEKVAIVTGAAKGIGKAIAEGFAREGAKVVVNDLLEGLCREVAGEINKKYGVRTLAVPGDVSLRSTAVKIKEETLREFGTIDILVNNAGIMISGLVLDYKEEDWDTIFAVNAKSVFLMCQEFGSINVTVTQRESTQNRPFSRLSPYVPGPKTDHRNFGSVQLDIFHPVHLPKTTRGSMPRSLAIESVFTVLAKVTFFEHPGGKWHNFRVNTQGEPAHPGHLLQNHTVENGFLAISTPGKGPMVRYEHPRNFQRFEFGKTLGDDFPGISLKGPLHLFFGERPGAGNGSEEIVGVGSPKTGDIPTGLRPGTGIGRMGMHHAPDFRKKLIEVKMDFGIHRGTQVPFHHLSLQIHHHHGIGRKLLIGNPAWLYDHQAFLPDDFTGVTPGIEYQPFLL